MSGESGRGGQRAFSTLIWWTFLGTVWSVIDLFVDAPPNRILWPTEIRPHWLGVIIGTVVFVTLVAVPRAVRRYLRPDPELLAARRRVATVLRAHVAHRAALNDRPPE